MAVYSITGFLLGLAALVANARSPDAAARRKTRVIMWGTVLGFTPALLLGIVTSSTGREPYELGFWLWMPTVVALCLMPLSFAYAVVKHRVLAVPVLLRRSARYLLVKRGFAALTMVAGLLATLVLALSFSRVLSARTPLALPTGLVVAAGFGALLVSAGMRMERRVATRIDRAFFRNAYDARQILEDLADHVRAATDRQGLAVLLERHLREALHPRRLILYLEDGGGQLHLERGAAPSGLESIGRHLPVLDDLARRAEPWEVPPQPSLGGLERLDPEGLVPVLGRQGRLLGIIVLGERLSEEPYSREDRRLLSSVASQAGLALENIQLAERIAERLEAERRATQEMDIAKQVQSRLFPQLKPVLATLEYAGGCWQARAVGGDYYDFPELGPGRLGLVLADVAGKGISAALLMATLQACLRSQQASSADLARLLRAVNRIFYPSAAPNRFATLFFGDYDDAARRLRYANCGHNPPVLLRASGAVERLAPTATVLGLFEEWDVCVAEVVLASGDLLLAFSDGASEAWSDQGEEFGEERLVRALVAHRDRPVAELLNVLAEEIHQFSGAQQEDDLTLVVARVR
jgi:sigma-B regulation protein RsbU (phosphoserine phosphatase)